jgi:hypothetical protein
MTIKKIFIIITFIVLTIFFRVSLGREEPLASIAHSAL